MCKGNKGIPQQIFKGPFGISCKGNFLKVGHSYKINTKLTVAAQIVVIVIVVVVVVVVVAVVVVVVVVIVVVVVGC